jgi:hypothetical protein
MLKMLALGRRCGRWAFADIKRKCGCFKEL